MKDYKKAYEIIVNRQLYLSGGIVLNAEKLILELVDKEIELESRKGKLVVGSEWECMLKTYGTVKIIDVHPLSERVTFRNMLFEHTEKIADFLLCFKPKGEYR